MLRKTQLIARLFVLLLGAALLGHAVDQATPTPVAHHKAHKKTAPLVLPPLPSGPLSQVPLDQMPAAAPKITYQNGLLTINAQNSTLGEILRQVRSVTGASIDIPPGGGNERVVTQLGPGAPRDVLAILLNGSSFNYVMLGSMADPNSVATVLLTPKPSAGGVQTAANVPGNAFDQNQPPQPMMPGRMPPQAFRDRMMMMQQQQQGVPAQAFPPPPAQAAAAADDSDDSDADDDKDDDSDAQPAPAPGQGQILQPQPDPNQEEQPNPNAGPKTPEQLLQMMRQGQQPGGPGVPPGVPNQPPNE
ncbi:MAG: hypothetical protein WBQ72_15275 [Terriglobales bacterium]|jgi:hypothetical protein